jgi:hypothetical protein
MVVWLPIIVAIITIILSIAGIAALVALLEMLKLVALAFIIPFTFLWLWAFFRKAFKLDQYIAAAISIVIVVFLAYAVYTSWWAIIILSIITIIGYLVWGFISKIGLKEILSIIKEAKK